MNQLRMYEDFCELTGLSVQPKKCHGFMMEKGMVNVGEPWKLCSQPIHKVNPSESVKYLGVQVGPEKGINPPDLKMTTERWLQNIKRAD